MKEYFRYIKRPENYIAIMLSLMLGIFVIQGDNSLLMRCVINIFCSMGIFHCTHNIFEMIMADKMIKKANEEMRKQINDQIKKLQDETNVLHN